ncbi:sugar phosphate isomerase/epimerase [Micromonospora sp. LHW51205]|uniref:sugar phosphate isomerase/epimerase family protein n=1 Tax=Micromonospora sp. LHW51205 TaxID=2248752 RepID=UPI000DE96B01|nr:sugar phosphate isomerase/epimerase family protein [Micromonospora sp. LHW51205]RBQ05663.1 sugar phosphate isomerase/epimerase [Micromonospora sp. LHW51205]
MSATTNPVCVSGMAAMSWALPEEIAMYRRTGADLVGLQRSKVASFGVAALGDLLARHDVRLGYLVHSFTAHPDDEPGWAQQVAALQQGVVDAGRLGADLVYLTSGPSAHLTWEEAAGRFAERIAPVVATAREHGVRLAVENTLPVKCDLSFTHTARDAVALADQCGIGICLDLYCCWQERGLTELIRDRVGQVEILQVSDFRVGTSTFPNRWVPGDGDLPMAGLLASVLRAGYTGVVDVELLGPAVEAEGAEPALTRSVAWTRAQIAAARP